MVPVLGAQFGSHHRTTGHDHIAVDRVEFRVRMPAIQADLHGGASANLIGEDGAGVVTIDVNPGLEFPAIAQTGEAPAVRQPQSHPVGAQSGTQDLQVQAALRHEHRPRRGRIRRQRIIQNRVKVRHAVDRIGHVLHVRGITHARAIGISDDLVVIRDPVVVAVLETGIGPEELLLAVGEAVTVRDAVAIDVFNILVDIGQAVLVSVRHPRIGARQELIKVGEPITVGVTRGVIDGDVEAVADLPPVGHAVAVAVRVGRVVDVVLGENILGIPVALGDAGMGPVILPVTHDREVLHGLAAVIAVNGQNHITGITGETRVRPDPGGAEGHAHVAVLAPAGAPTVLEDPVLAGSLVIAPADNRDSMSAVCAVGSEDAAGVAAPVTGPNIGEQRTIGHQCLFQHGRVGRRTKETPVVERVGTRMRTIPRLERVRVRQHTLEHRTDPAVRRWALDRWHTRFGTVEQVETLPAAVALTARLDAELLRKIDVAGAAVQTNDRLGRAARGKRIARAVSALVLHRGHDTKGTPIEALGQGRRGYREVGLSRFLVAQSLQDARIHAEKLVRGAQ